MISMLVTGSWSSVQIELDNGVDPAETWTPTTGVTDAYSAAEDFIAWIDSTFVGESASWAANSGGGNVAVTISTQASYTWTSNATAQSLLGAEASASGSDLLWEQPTGLVLPTSIVWQQLRRQGITATAGAQGSMPGEIAGLSHQTARVRWIHDRQNLEFMRAAIAAASSPRRAYILDDATWRLVELGEIDIRRTAGTVYLADTDVVVTP